MVNKEKAIKRELTRLRKTQNPEQIDFRKMRKVRAAKTKLFELRRKGTVAPVKVAPTEKKKKKKAKPKKKPKEKEPELEVIDQEPELEVLEDEPELEVIKEKPKPKKKAKKKKEKEPELEVVEEEPELEDISLEDLYTYDEDIDEEDV
ncbi:MAG: hypothetical protein PVJ05_01960 [Candidatus Thorarchaeota archaeon]|jgi:hypothetical protein